MATRNTTVALLAVLLGTAMPVSTLAQSQDSGSASDSASTEQTSEDGDLKPFKPRRSRDGERQEGGKTVRITPYIDVSQVLLAELKPDRDLLTYTQVGVGVDAAISGRRTEASASLRYERRIGYGNNVDDSDLISGLVRGYTHLTEGLKFEVGALATRSQVENSGAALSNSIAFTNSTSNVFSAFAGPTISTQSGDVAIEGSYRIGYTKVDTSDDRVTGPGIPSGDVFDSSLVHNATLRAGVKPGDVLPIGIAVVGSASREDIANLDQRADDFSARLDLTLPVTSSLALVGGAGHEDVRISSRDAQRDALGNAIVGSDGRFVTDKSLPRQIAYESQGLIWDAGVLWRPGRRTMLEARVGHRYGGMSYLGTFGYQPSSRSAINVSVYDSISGFGGKLNGALALLPSSFQANRNPLTGDIGTCVSSLDQGNCLSSALGSVRSATFRSRGIAGSYGYKFGRYTFDLGGGYDRRRLIAAPNTVLAAANGIIEENIWATAQLNGTIDQNSGFSTNVYGNWFQSGATPGGDVASYGAAAAYNRQLTQRLSGKIATGIDSVNRQGAEDIITVSALVGLRYNF